MTIYEDHTKRVLDMKARHRKELDELDELLKAMQSECSHKWERVEDLFYALGETYAGKRCKECGATRRI